MKRRKTVVTIALTAIGVAAAAVIFKILNNAVFAEMSKYICERHSIVKSVKFDSCQFYSHPYSRFTCYVDSSCTFEQAKEIFEDFANHFSDELVNRLQEEMHGKAFLDADFTNIETNLRIYCFQTDDIENFVHWKVTEGKVMEGDDWNYTFDRRIN